MCIIACSHIMCCTESLRSGLIVQFVIVLTMSEPEPALCGLLCGESLGLAGYIQSAGGMRGSNGSKLPVRPCSCSLPRES